MPVRPLSDSESSSDEDDDIEWPIPGVTTIGVKVTLLVDAGSIRVSLDPVIYQRPPVRPVVIRAPMVAPESPPAPSLRGRMKRREPLSRAMAEFQRRSKRRACKMTAPPFS